MSGKKYILLFFSILLFGFISKGQNTFNKHYQSGNLSASTRIQLLDLNTALLTSYYKDSSNNQQGLDLKQLDLNGNVIKRKRYLFKTQDFLSYANNNMQCDVSNATSVLSGASSDGTVSVVVYASFNKTTLDTNWVRYFSDGIYGYNLNNAFKTKPNEIWFMGDRNKNATGYPCTFKTDTLGNVLSIKDFTSFPNHYGLSVFYDQLSNLLYFSCIDASIQNNTTTRIICTDTMGNTIWNQPLVGSIGISQIAKRNNYIVASGFKITDNIANNNYYKMYLVKANCLNNGSVLWEKTYGHQTLINSLYAFTINTDESIACAGTFKYSNYYALDHDGIILKANSNGDSLWSRTFSSYGMSVQECFYDIKPTSDGGYIMCGFPYYAPNTQGWVVKTDSLGMAPGVTYTSIKENQILGTDLNIWPNPADNYFFLDSDYSEISHIEIINEMGRVISKPRVSEDNKKINTGNLSAGIYVVKITDSNGLSKTKKLVIVR